MRNVYWVFLLVLVGCISDEVEEGYLTEDEMTEVVLDIYLSEARLTFEKIDLDQKEIWPEYRKILLERHGLTDSVYNENMSYYLTNPKLLDRVYQRVVDSLILYQQKFNEADRNERR